MVPAVVVAQARSSEFCSKADPGADVIVRICTHERGMIVLPQPQLYLQVHTDGRAEYETNGPSLGGQARAYYTLATKSTLLSATELADLGRFISEPELWKAKDEYPMYRRWDDSSMITRVVLKNSRTEKTIILNNFQTDDEENKLHYPAALIGLMEIAQDVRDRATGLVRAVPEISFCELVRHSDRYLGKRSAMYADVEYHASVTALGTMTSEREFLFDHTCDSPEWGPLRTTESVGLGYSGPADAVAKMRKITSRIRSYEFGGRGRAFFSGRLVRAVESGGLALRFEITQVKGLERLIVPFEGVLKLGWFYSDAFNGGGKEPVLSSALRMPYHHVGRVEWVNAGLFPMLKVPGPRYVMFRVLSETVQMVGSGRWDSVYRCELVEVK
jgi:hypothetical protein